MRMKLESQPEQGKWISVDVDVMTSRRGNQYVKYQDEVHVFESRKEGTPVLCKVHGHWTCVGRIARDSLFIGPGLSYSEWVQTPEGQASIKEMLLGLKTWRVSQ
jgi:hypothetical protein